MKTRKTSVSVSLVKILILYSERIGIDPQDALRAARIDPKVLKISEARVSSEDFIRLWRSIVSAGKAPHSGLALGRALTLHYPAGSLLFTMMLNCERIGGALDVLVRYHRLMADAVQPVLEVEEGTVTLSWRTLDPDFREPPDLAEALLGVFHALLQTLSQDRIVPERVCLARARPDDPEEYRRLFKTEMVFNAPGYSLSFRAQDLDLEIRLANPSLYALLERHAAQIVDSLAGDRKWSEKAIGIMSDMLNSGAPPGVKAVATRLNISTRSLQEKLRNERTGFRALLEDVRRRIAVDRLQTGDSSLCELAFLLGYADQSAFQRAFKRWTGRTPAAFRKSRSPARFTNHSSK